MMDQALLQAVGLSRAFGDLQAVRPTQFGILAGEIIVLTGPNGAGKTTLLQCLSGLLRPTSGNVLVEGFDLYKEEVAAKERLAFVPDVPRFYPELTAWEHLHFIGMAYRVTQEWEARAETLLQEFNLWDARDFYPHNLSHGMRLKLGLILALMRPFKVLLLDEPTSALDAESVGLVITKLIDLRDHGCAVLVSSHDLSMLEALKCRQWRMMHGQLETG